jgi:ABC-type multidrug transport system fused ATPase/permease subunit
VPVPLAALTGGSAFLVTGLLAAEQTAPRWGWVLGLLAAALGIGLLRFLERVLAEKLGQHYVQEIRKDLVAAALADSSGPSIGITIARTTNDLSGVRNWIALGIAPLTAGIPLIAGTLAAVWLLSPALALAVVLPMSVFTVALGLLSKPAFDRARELRRRRGRLAAQVADIAAAASAIRAAGGNRREVRQVERAGGQVSAAAVRHAAVAGWIRGTAAAAASVSVVTVAAAGAWSGIDTATLAAALTVVGMLAAPVSDLGRVVEYRQKFRAARRVLVPALGPLRQATAAELRRRHAAAAAAKASTRGPTVRISRLFMDGGLPLPSLQARPGDRIVVQSSDPARTTAVFEALLGLRPELPMDVRLAGRNLSLASAAKRRKLVGYAARGLVLERGTVARAVRYRRPDLPAAVTGMALSRVGLAQAVARLPAGERTVLKRGGQPLTFAERGRLQLARAMLGDPPLLLLDHIDGDLGSEGTELLAEILRTYPGVAIIAADAPEKLAADYSAWEIDPADLGRGGAAADMDEAPTSL